MGGWVMSKSGVYSVGKKFFSVLSLRATSLLEKGTCCFDDFFFVCVCVSSVCSRIMFCVFRYYVGLGLVLGLGSCCWQDHTGQRSCQ